MDEFIDAADYLSSVIDGDRPDYIAADDPNNFFDTDIDDVLIKVTLSEIDGTGGVLGQAGPTHIIWDPSAAETSEDALPFAGEIEIDIADAETFLLSGQLYDIALHEMMHVIGFGSLWEYSGTVEMTFDDMGTKKPVDDVLTYDYLGVYAKAENGGTAPVVETDGGSGTAGSHWDDETYTNELMTGYIDDINYLSSMSIGSLADLGYEIADGFLLA
jgi:hypothetical protein